MDWNDVLSDHMMYGKRVVLARPWKRKHHGTKKHRKKRFNRYYTYVAKMQFGEVYDTPHYYVMTPETWEHVKKAL